MEKQKCVLYDRDCIDCKECEFCDLDPTKICDNCGKCLEVLEFATLKIDSLDGVELKKKDRTKAYSFVNGKSFKADKKLK
ncbi:MAG: hypothetical protein IJF75_04295 [Clostridia bacterium]|nr:hypothetical protein [Clostridia bacterium]